MELQYSELPNNIRLLKLTGQLDIAGVGKIETPFAGYCVDFLASIGIRLLTLTAKSVMSRGGKMVLLNPVHDVQHVLEITGIPAIIPIYSHLESAETLLLSS
jgi:hypothetical protein